MNYNSWKLLAPAYYINKVPIVVTVYGVRLSHCYYSRYFHDRIIERPPRVPEIDRHNFNFARAVRNRLIHFTQEPPEVSHSCYVEEQKRDRLNSV